MADRREFLKGLATASVGVMSGGATQAAAVLDGWDRFGGWKARAFEPTGFFRVEKTDRWWIVTPEGHAFLSFGINHLHPDIWKHDYNQGAWKKRLGLANLESNDFSTALRAWYLGACRDYGINTVGIHSSLSVANTPVPAMPYVLPIHFVDIPHYKKDVPDSNFVDVFSGEFASHCDQMANRLAAPNRDDPFLLGYAMTDCPMFTEEDCRERPDTVGGGRRPARVGWPRRLRNLGGGTPGKKVYVRTVQELYGGEISDFNSAYGVEFDSFDALESTENWRPRTDLSNGNETRDNVEFLKRVVAKYYETARDAIRRYDTNHMFFGDKLNANSDTVDSVLPVTSRFTDLVFYQMYGRYEVQKPGLDRWASKIDKPIINGDSSYTVVTENMPRPYGPVADNREERAEWTEEFFRNAFARPEFVGWHYCGVIDAPNLIERKKGRQHAGLFSGYGVPCPALKKVITRCTDEMYQIASG